MDSLWIFTLKEELTPNASHVLHKYIRMESQLLFTNLGLQWPQNKDTIKTKATHQFPQTNLNTDSQQNTYTANSRIYEKYHAQNSRGHFNKYRNAFNRIQYAIILKSLKKLWIEGTYLNIKEAVYDTPTVNIVLNGEDLKALLLKPRARQKFACFLHFYSMHYLKS